jgi:hypothetical protein
MIRMASRLLACALVLLVLSAPARGAVHVLAGDTNSYLGIWNGTSPFTSGGTLTGTVDWAVYGPGNAPAGFAGYALTPGEFLYTYQIYVYGDVVSSLAIHVENSAHDPGTFTATDVSGDAPYLVSLPGTPGDVTWSFSGILAPNGTSTGLAFTSPNTPTFADALVSDEGQSALLAVPSNSAPAIPEPSSLLIWICLIVIGLACSSRRRLIGRNPRTG